MTTEAEKPSLDLLIGDPKEWRVVLIYHNMNDGEVELRECPQCGAVVLDCYQHKAWHLQHGF